MTTSLDVLRADLLALISRRRDTGTTDRDLVDAVLVVITNHDAAELAGLRVQLGDVHEIADRMKREADIAELGDPSPQTTAQITERRRNAAQLKLVLNRNRS
jgi:hypothetical protein